LIGAGIVRIAAVTVGISLPFIGTGWYAERVSPDYSRNVPLRAVKMLKILLKMEISG
jgi:hypothetical protein